MSQPNDLRNDLGDADFAADTEVDDQLPSGDGQIPPEFFSLGGRHIIWVPEIPKPDMKLTYASVDEALDMYRRYATQAGFDVRKATVKRNKKIGDLTHRYMLCSREGPIESVYVDTIDEKNDKMQLDNSSQLFIEKLSRLNIGPSKAYQIMQELKSSYNIEGGTVVDFKNETRKVNCLMEKEDAQMIVDMFVRRKKGDPNLTFEFICNKGSLVSLFWADEASKANYKEFGDIVSCDAKFRMNK